jgi:hypothetical protein
VPLYQSVQRRRIGQSDRGSDLFERHSGGSQQMKRALEAHALHELERAEPGRLFGAPCQGPRAEATPASQRVERVCLVQPGSHERLQGRDCLVASRQV